MKSILTKEYRDKLVEAAIEARCNAYAPYSGDYNVGAAVLTEGDKIFTGCNIENASFGATMCAERVAIFKAICEGFRKIRALAVVTESTHPEPPCGLCLQVLAEFGSEAEIIMINMAGDLRVLNIKKLLPETFDYNRRNKQLHEKYH